MKPRVVVVGLGPAGPDLITAGTLEAIAGAQHCVLRTRRHPSAWIVEDAASFDDIYEAAGSIDEVYPAMVERLVDLAAVHGEVLYAVPGAPLVAERSVELLLAEDRVEVEVLPAVSFADLVWSTLGVDPIAEGVRIVDGHRFLIQTAGERGPFLVAQCDTVEVLSDIKLSVAEPPDEPVAILSHLGLEDAAVEIVDWSDLDRTLAPDHLTSVYIPRLGRPVAGELAAFAETVRRLRADCPWDRAQTHESLQRYLIEEAYEVIEAITAGDPVALEEELGDLLFQVVFHATLAEESGHFDLAGLISGIDAKLIARHPHVFAGEEVEDLDELRLRWETGKAVEKGRTSVLEGIPAELPALLYALKVLKRLAATGQLEDLQLRPEQPVEGASIGETLLGLVETARRADVDPEAALRSAIRALVSRVEGHAETQ